MGSGRFASGILNIMNYLLEPHLWINHLVNFKGNQSLPGCLEGGRRQSPRWDSAEGAWAFLSLQRTRELWQWWFYHLRSDSAQRGWRVSRTIFQKFCQDVNAFCQKFSIFYLVCRRVTKFVGSWWCPKLKNVGQISSTTATPSTSNKFFHQCWKLMGHISGREQPWSLVCNESLSQLLVISMICPRF